MTTLLDLMNKPIKGDIRKDGMKYDGRQWRVVGKQYHMNDKGMIFYGDKYRSLDSYLQQGGKIEDIIYSKSKVKNINTIVDFLYKEVKSGQVYAIVNPAWPDWVKIGKAIDAKDRCDNYQTSSPLRDYDVLYTVDSEDRAKKESEAHKLFEEHSDDRQNEWFKINKSKIKSLFDVLSKK